ncbi:STM4015 family protein [Streptomyces sp. NPDC006458]|uniref:STM4015 family protein n=1 Tax=Streptomyces sp. NPDC006458 TaxID=3154302 RepID=UPI0033A20F63
MPSYYPSHLQDFHDLPVHTFPAEEVPGGRPLPGAASVAWRISTDCEFPFEPIWRRFLDQVPGEDVTALVIGPWWDDYDTRSIDPVLELITADAERLPHLRGVFLADLVSEEMELSWIQQGEVTRVLRAWPGLRELGVRGGEGLTVEPLRHDGLRDLWIESGGLPAEPVRALGACEFPALERLELWLGTTWYGGDCTAEDIAPLLTGLGRCPGLRHLGLQNSDIQDDIAAALAAAPVVAGLESLDLSMGTLGDEGGAALLAGQPLTHLRSLDLDHHYLSEELTDRLRQALEPHGVRLSLAPSRRSTHDPEARFVAVGE